MQSSSPLITPEELFELTNATQGRHLVILDVRWRLDQPDGRAEFEAGHIPGAVYVDLGSELAGHGAPSDGRHPLPHVDDLQQSARSWGIDNGDIVVVYDDLGGMSAARAWWLLRYAGVAEVRVLDGAIRGWITAGFELATGAEQTASGNVDLKYGALPVLTIGDAASLPDDGILLDARAPERYRGDVEPIDPKAGHIPGAISAPTSDNLAVDGRMRSADDLRDRFAALGVASETGVGVYCGSGVTAAHEVLALTVAGFTASLFAGSWSQWSNTPGRAVATGSSPRD